MPTHVASQLAWERMVTAVEKVRDRLRRAARALEDASIPYAIVGGNAVAVHVAEVDEGAVRFTPDVDVLIRRDDFDRVKEAMANAGFVYRCDDNLSIFLDGPDAKTREAVHVFFAGEKIRPQHQFAGPNLVEVKRTETACFLALDALVRMKLTSFRTKDCVHVRDMIDVGLVDASWLPRLPSELAQRLQTLLDTPEG